MTVENQDLLDLTTEIVAAFVAKNNITVDQLSGLIRGVHRSLARVGSVDSEPLPERPKPAVPIRKSLQSDHIVCLEDGRKFKMLKRHLKTVYDLTPDEYRQKWGLPADYPMVAPEYAQRRSKLAKKIGLGRQGKARRK
ncbi:MAG: MucR family transcriptional regulator [Rhodospirillales bacterium]